MNKTLTEIDAFVTKMGLPARDLWDIPSSQKRFPDGAHWRTEISGIETEAVFEAMLDEAQKRRLPVHRIMATVNGATFYDFAELKALAKAAKAARVEAIVTIGPRKAWDVGARELSAWGTTGFRFRGADSIRNFICDMLRCIEAGFRGFLIYDEGLLSILSRMRKDGFIPKETVFKWSVYGGYCSGAGGRIVESLGANTLNPTSDVSLPILAGMRKAMNIPLDVYMWPFDSMGGEFRVYEAAEIARVASPCYFKFEPGTSDNQVYRPWVAVDWVKDFVRMKVKSASIVKEVLEQQAPEIKCSENGPADLVMAVA
jgi:hypothetical protein